MSDVERMMAIARARSAGKAAPTVNPQTPAVPSYIPQQSKTGGFVDSMLSSLPELFGADPSGSATAFRAASPVAGFVSQILPQMVPYGGMYSLSKTAAGAAALAKGMSGVKKAGQAIGMNTVGRPVIAGAVKEMLRYSPLELARLGATVAGNPENTGEMFADVALSTAFAGAFGGAGGFLRAGGTHAIKQGISKVLGQENMFAHPVTDLRAARTPEALELATPTEIEAAQKELTRQILNDNPTQGYLSKKAVPLINAVQGGDPKTAAQLNALLKFNSREVKGRPFSRQKLWEGDLEDSSTLNPGELEPIVKSLGFQDATEMAENVLTARVISLGSQRAANSMAKLIESPAMLSYGDGLFAAKTDTGATLLLKRIAQGTGKEIEEAIPTPNPAGSGTVVDDSIMANPMSPADEAVEAIELPAVDKDVIDDAFGTPSEIRLFENGEMAPEVIDQIRKGGMFRADKIEPATDEMVTTLSEAAGRKIAQFEARIGAIQQDPRKMLRPISDGDLMPKNKAIEFMQKQIDDELDVVAKVKRQNERWRVTQNIQTAATPTPPVVVPAVAPKPAMAKGKKGKKISPEVLPPTAPKGPFTSGDKWAAILTDRPGAVVKDLEKLNAAAGDIFATQRRMFQPMDHAPHFFNAADDSMLKIVSPMDVSRIARQSRTTWVSETMKSMKNKAVKEMGLTDNKALYNYANHLYDVFAPGMFKEQRNTLYARYTGLLQNRLRTVTEQVNLRTRGAERVKTGAKGVMGKDFERKMVDDGMSFRETVAQLTDEEFEVVVKALMTQTPAKDVAQLAKDGVISPNALAAVKRMQDLNADFMHKVVLPATQSLGEKGNFNLLEGYVVPRVFAGDFRTLVKNENGELVYMATGKSAGAAERIAKAIVAEGEAAGQKYHTDPSYMKHAVEADFHDISAIMENVGRKLDQDPAAAEIVRKAMQKIQFVNVRRQSKLPFNARAPKNLEIERTGIKANEATYTRDEFIGAFENQLTRMGNFAAVHSFMERWGNEIMSLKGDNHVLFEDVMRRAQQAMGIEGKITQMLNEKLQPMLGPQLGSKAATKIAAATNKTMYAWQLGIVNPSFALLNALSPLQSVLPHLAFVLNAPRAESGRLFNTLPLLDGGKLKGFGNFLDPARMLRESIRQLRTADPELQHIHGRLRDDNTLHPQLFEEHVGGGSSHASSLKEAFNRGGYVEFLYEGSTWMARKSEDFARIVSANAGYLAGKHLGLEDEALYHFTKRFVETTNYMYGQSDRARLITGPVGSVFGLFKNWQMHFMGMMATYAGLGMKHNVWSPLVWQSGAAIALGGLGATPLRHIADGLANWHGAEDGGFQWLQEHFSQPVADGAWFGPASIFGASLQASSTMPGTDVRNDLTSFGNAVAWERAKQLGAALGEGWSLSATGENPLTSSNFRNQLVAAVAPRAVSRATSVIEGDYINSMQTGNPSLQNPSWQAKTLHGLGMNAVEIERGQTVAKKLYRDQEARKAATSNYGKMMAEAKEVQDWEAMDRLRLRAESEGLDLSNVGKSMQNYERRGKGDALSRYSKDDVARARVYLGQE